MTRYTYSRRIYALYGKTTVIIPDQVFEDQKGWDESGKTFTAITVGSLWQPSRKVRVRLDGEAYALHLPGTGNIIVKSK